MKLKYPLGAVALAAVTSAAAGEANNQRPNILYIMCDDIGYGDLGCYGQRYISTPCIDSMASEGMRFTQAYAGSPVSAPSRATLMTGQHSGHTEVRANKEYWSDSPRVYYGDNEDFGIVGQHPYDTNHIILPEIMKRAGYRTGMFGKWAGGYEGSPSVPETRGIDEFFGYICQFQAHLYYPNFLNRFSRSMGDTATVRVVLEENIKHPMCGDEYAERTQYSADIIHRKAMEWLESQDGSEPFFGIFTYTLPHAELFQPRDSILLDYYDKFTDDKTFAGQCPSRYNAVTHTHAQFAGMITRLDAYVGEILGLLKRKGIDENTLVIFTSDNGPHEEGGADPEFFGRDGKLRGIKQSTHEGGIRIPFIVRWPGKVAAGVDNDHQLAFYDVMPTLMEIAGIEGYPDKLLNGPDDVFDGISFAPTLLGSDEQSEHQFLYWEYSPTDMMGLRMGNWKLVVKHGTPELYNLALDLHEDNNVADLYPEIVDMMVGVLLSEHRPSDLFHVTLPAARKAEAGR